MEYGKFENDNVVLFTEKYITVKKEVKRFDYKSKTFKSSIENVKIYNPSPDTLLQEGWYPVEYIDKVGENTIEDNILKIYTGKARTVEEAKFEMQMNIDMYDTSSAVNGFYYGDQELWIDKATRVGLVNAINSAIALDNEDITFGIQDISVTLPCQQALQMLYALEMYALACYNVTLNHKNTVYSLETVEDIDAYDYTAGYPEKLRFEV